MKHGMNSEQMQKSNRILVFRTLMENEGMTRANLAAELGLQKATITNIINEFLEMGIVEVVGDSASGRRGEKLCLRLEGHYILTMGVTRKGYEMAVYSLDGHQEETIEYRFHEGEKLADTMEEFASRAAEYQKKYGKDRFAGYCMAVPGPYMRKNNEGSETFAVPQFPGWNELDIRGIVEDALGEPVTIVHDAKLSAYAEWLNSSEAKENKKVSMIVIRSRGYGIGAGVIVNGKIVVGQMGIAGEVGQMGINYNGRAYENNSFEACAGTESAVRYVRERLFEFPDSPLHENSSYMEILEAFRKGDPLATWAMEKVAWMLGYGISNMIYLLNPDCIILGVDYPDDKSFLDVIKRVVRSQVHPLISQNTIIRYSELLEDSFLLGGYYYILKKLVNSGKIFDIYQGSQCQVP